MLKHGILGLLNYHPFTGYEIMEVFRDSLRFFWNAQTSQIYRELQGLERRAWVSKTTVHQKGKPDKNVYSITPEGRDELLRWLGNDDLGLTPNEPLLMKAFFLGERSPEENILYFQQIKEACQMFLKSLDPIPQYIETYSNLIDRKEKSLYWQMTVDYGRRNMKMLIDWAEDCIQKIKKTYETNEQTN